MICILKIYGFHVVNHQIIKKGWDVTPVTYGGRTNGGKWKIVQYSGIPETAITKSTASTSWWWHSMMTCLLDAPAARIITSVIYISIVMNIISSGSSSLIFAHMTCMPEAPAAWIPSYKCILPSGTQIRQLAEMILVFTMIVIFITKMSLIR